jgi:putative tail protein
MGTINQIKQLAETDTPLLFFQCTLPSGDIVYWSTHSIQFNGQSYAAKVLKHNLFDLQLSADDAMDGISQLSLTLANADSTISQLDAAIGLKGSQLTVYFAFADLPSLTITSESTVLFRGIAGDPDEIGEDFLNLSFTNKLSLQRVPVPDVRIQRSCPWNFPARAEQRLEARDGGALGRFSRFFRCGYSADQAGGVGNLNGALPFTSCDKSRAQCEQRGMFNIDSAANATRRFGGFEFVPSAILVRTSGDKTSHVSPLVDNAAKYNDPVPIVYGSGWIKAPVIFARNDGNLTHMEVLVGMGAIPSGQNILKVVVNGIEIPVAASGQDLTTTGWYGVISTGQRQGNFNADFADSAGNPLGDPHGTSITMSVVVPNRISSGKSLADVEVLMQGIDIDVFNSDGSFQATTYSNNPAWVILDILRRAGWSLSELDLSKFAASAAICQELISTTDLNGAAIQVPRYQCNLVLTRRQSAAAVVRGIRVAASLMLRYGPTGLLELLPEAAIARQQPSLPDGGNSVEPLNDGWPAYEFSDGAGPFSGIVRTVKGNSSLRLSSRSVAETSNRLSVEFQDESNEYQQDSLSLVDSDDVGLIGYEISSQSTALGVANFSQATRILLRQLDKSTKGNRYVQFQTSFRALKVRPGDIIALTYFKEGLVRVPFRVIKLSPSTNYELVTITAQIHDDDWYSDSPATLGGAGRQPGTQIRTPRPLIGSIQHNDPLGKFEFFDFAVQESVQTLSDGSAIDTLSISFAVPAKPSVNSSNLPLLSLSPGYLDTGGSLAAGSSYYYAVSAVDSNGSEGELSFTVPALIPGGTSTNCVVIQKLSFPASASAFNVYRGVTPQTLYRIALAQTIGPVFIDSGLTPQPIGPPDASFDHANFYYRYQYAGPYPTTIHSANTIGWDSLGATSLVYSGKAVRIMEGKGRGQERSISSNSSTTLTVSPAWSVEPDVTSIFAITEPSWKFAAVSSTSPAQFEIPFRTGAALQISGRGANVNDQESDPELCPLTTWTLGEGSTDLGLPGTPSFLLSAPGGGDLTLYQVGFTDSTNVFSVTSGTLQIFHWNELNSPSPTTLAAAIDSATTTLQLTNAGAPIVPFVGQLIEIDQELMTVQAVNLGSGTYTVIRGVLGSTAAAHAEQAYILHLDNSTIVAPFAQGFFENLASANYLHTVNLPDVRICAAEFYVTNAFGNSQASQIFYSDGLRTLSGGQFSLQVSGYLATQQNAAPPLIIEASHAVRDMRATVSQAATGYDISINILQDGVSYANLVIFDGHTVSDINTNVLNLPPLAKESVLTMNITLSVSSGGTVGLLSPGRDLTVTIRL